MAKEVMRIFRAMDAPLLSESDDEHEFTFGDTPQIVIDAATKMAREVFDDGYMVKSQYSAPGFSLTYVWFKANFPLARHSHDRDCLYYVVSGDVKLGTEMLGPGDGFFVPKDMPYTYTVGEKSVEVLEFRHTSFFNVRTLAGTQAYWDKQLQAVIENRDTWRAAEPPIPALRR